MKSVKRDFQMLPINFKVMDPNEKYGARFSNVVEKFQSDELK